MRSGIRQALAIMCLIATALLLPAGSTTAADVRAPFVVVNSASYIGDRVATGALLTIFTTNQVSPEGFDAPPGVYPKWQQYPNHGLWIEGSCSGPTEFKTLPVLYVGRSYDGNQINLYLPNSIGSEPWGGCTYTGPALFRVHPAGGGQALEAPVTLLPAHPGIFMVGEAPAGDHVDRYGHRTPLADCPAKIQADPTACTVRIGTEPSELAVLLTGAEWFLCDPCTTDNIRFELAPSSDAPEHAWVRQTLRSLITGDMGVEKAAIRLLPDTAPGVHYLRVRNSFASEYPKPLRIELGQPS